MRLLLDTHTLIWWDSDPGRLSSVALSAIREPANEILLSAVSVWEMVIKAQLNKMSLRLPLADMVAQQKANGLRILGVTVEHVLAVEGLPSIHKDPFDRLLAAQARLEQFHLVTSDPAFRGFGILLLW